MKVVGAGEILETYLNSAPKNTSETDIFPHGTKSLLTSAIRFMTADERLTPEQTIGIRIQNALESKT